MSLKRNMKSAVSWLNQVAGKKKIYIAELLILQIMLSGTSILYAVFLRNLIDYAVAKDISGLGKAAAGGIILMVLQIAICAAGRFLQEWSRAGLENQLKARLFSCLLRKDYAQVTAVHSGEWMNRLTSDTVIVANGMTGIIPDIAGMFVRLMGALAVLLYLEPRLICILVPGGCVMMFTTYGFRKILMRLHKMVQEADGEVRTFLQERLKSMMIIRTFAMEGRIEREADGRMQRHKAARIRRNHFSNLCNTGFSIMMDGAYIFGAIYCGYAILNGKMSYGTLTAVLQMINQIRSPIANITGYLPRYYAMIASAERLREAEQYQDVCNDTIASEKVHTFYETEFKSIGFSKASFTYHPPVQKQESDMPVVLSDINLEIRKGEYVAFTGHSGSGKSTILKLLMCLYPLDSGERYLFGNSRQTLTLAWRNLFAYVPQGNQLMSGTIREILTFGNEEDMKREERIWQALQIACADEFVDTLKNRLDTELGENGLGLSEGQMQRIAIARAVFSAHPVLMLDESTSALDEVTEKKVLRNLRTMTDKTVLIVTHRSAVLEICDRRIVVAGDGITEISIKKG